MDASLLPSRRGVLAGLSGLSSLLLAAPLRAAEPLPEIQVTKDPSCGCCEAWVTHIRAAGFPVQVTEAPVNPVKARLGVPRSLASCHTAQVGGYVIEGHVPAGAILRLLAEKPPGIGLAVPGMPVGSPGMEADGVPPDTYDVILFGPELQRPFARYRGGTPL
ncbi:DUF411 domain-containing protein [Methylorubrum suomiense]|uniref:Metal-binding protein n=1 Tax=Methylorubrum suomiense TaxID=144191 RepID=A0ABQ4V860_9HYPH|nr:DUF411 domain-containing protein [Methylorubrum suomiense]GJE78532.1 hypothetical protein BGCPKDLD_5149 [Methylorubrum suomiense]